MQLIATDNRKVIVGLGMTGLSCARYFSKKNITFSVVDSRKNPPGLSELQEEFPEAPVFLGDISDESLEGAGELVVSPGVALEEPAIRKAVENGVVVCGDIDLFRQEVSSPIIAITGSNGKSTVTTLVGEMAKACGKVVAVGGNIGIPALDLLTEKEPDLYVLELSSFQLERTEKLSAEVATVLNISADHMDRYPNLVAYHQAKHRIFRNCKKVVINRGDTLTKPLIADDVEVWSFGLGKPDFKAFGLIQEGDVDYLAYEFEKLMPVSEMKLVGGHNVENVLAALALGKAIGFEMEPMLEAIKNFTGLPHRCQFVSKINDVDFYNDSKGTNVGAAIAAIEGLSNHYGKIILIAGGEGKGTDFSPLLPVIKKACRAVIVLGESADELEQLFAEECSVIKVESMKSAVTTSLQYAECGDAILLSPACASFDMFQSYQHRGDVFANRVQDIAQQYAEGKVR